MSTLSQLEPSAERVVVEERVDDDLKDILRRSFRPRRWRSRNCSAS